MKDEETGFGYEVMRESPTKKSFCSCDESDVGHFGNYIYAIAKKRRRSFSACLKFGHTNLV